MQGKYSYKVPNFQGDYTFYKMNVEILEETNKSYKVKYLETHSNGSNMGYITWVRKKSVKTI